MPLRVKALFDNKIFTEDANEPTKEFEIDKYGEANHLSNDVYPIPLTPEILEKCGFQWDIYWQGLTDGNWVLTEGENNTYRLAYGKRRHDVIVYGIKYLHQLQNLFFCLVGQELNYTP